MRKSARDLRRSIDREFNFLVNLIGVKTLGSTMT